MRLALLSPCFLAALLPSVAAISLTDFQPIKGFSQQCTQAYGTPLTGCSSSDFQKKGCSLDCINFLEALTKILNTECKGTTAFPNTLIGLFFSQQGTSTLCPNVLGTSGGDEGSSAAPSSAAASSAETPESTSAAETSSTPEPSTSAVETASTAAASSTSAKKGSTSSAPATTTPSTKNQNSFTSSTYSPISPSPPPPPHTFAISSSSTTQSAQSSPTANSNAQSGGEGTILDIGSGSSAPPNTRPNTASWAWAMGAFMLFVWVS